MDKTKVAEAQSLWEKLHALVFGEKKEGILTESFRIKDFALKFQGDDAMMAIAVELGLTGEATLADVLMAIKTLKGDSAPAAPSPEGEGGTMPMQKQEFTKLQERVVALEGENKTLKKREILAKYQKACEGLIALAVKPGELAEELAGIEEKVGEETAQKILKQYQAANDVAKVRGITSLLGRSKVATGEHPVEVEMRAWAKEQGKTEAEASAFFQANNPEKWREFRASKRNGS